MGVVRIAAWAATLSVTVWLSCAGVAAAAPGKNGLAVYNRHCYFCHGYSGDARTVASSMLTPPPRDFTTGPLGRERMLEALRDGRPGTAMQPFRDVLSDTEMAAVVDFIRDNLQRSGEPNLSYHSPVNGWSGDPKISPAAPFVIGDVAVDLSGDSLSAELRAGQQLFLSSCVSCHAGGGSGPLEWRNEAVTWPEGNYLEHGEAGADPVTQVFERHDVPPLLDGADATVRQGERLYLANCAHCHAQDGTGRNWIGSFLQPAPPDFTVVLPGRAPGEAELVRAIARGTRGTSMPAWERVLDPGQIRALVNYLQAAFARYTDR